MCTPANTCFDLKDDAGDADGRVNRHWRVYAHKFDEIMVANALYENTFLDAGEESVDYVEDPNEME